MYVPALAVCCEDVDSIRYTLTHILSYARKRHTGVKVNTLWIIYNIVMTLLVFHFAGDEPPAKRTESKRRKSERKRKLKKDVVGKSKLTRALCMIKHFIRMYTVHCTVYTFAWVCFVSWKNERILHSDARSFTRHTCAHIRPFPSPSPPLSHPLSHARAHTLTPINLSARAEKAKDMQIAPKRYFMAVRVSYTLLQFLILPPQHHKQLYCVLVLSVFSSSALFRAGACFVARGHFGWRYSLVHFMWTTIPALMNIERAHPAISSHHFVSGI